MNVVLPFNPQRVEDLRAFLQRAGFLFQTRPHALLGARLPGVNLTAYPSGKLLLQGPRAEAFARGLVEAGQAAPPPDEKRSFRAAKRPTRTLAEGNVAEPLLAGFTPHAGADESGKGDYFGPLVTAAVHVPDRETATLLLQKGVRDSKLVPDAEAGPLAALVRNRCPHATLVLQPPRYNELYGRTGNLNDLLAWAHATTLEDLLAQTGPVDVVVDQFARPEVLRRHLLERARATNVEQVVRGESDLAVAAASLLARAEFLAGLAALETRHGVRLPKGAGAPVLRAAKALGARGGQAGLAQVAKLHFATTRAALDG